jgi:hypothetical protein
MDFDTYLSLLILLALCYIIYMTWGLNPYIILGNGNGNGTGYGEPPDHVANSILYDNDTRIIENYDDRKYKGLDTGGPLSMNGEHISPRPH